VLEEADRREAPAELIRGLAVLAEPPTEEHGALAEALGLPRPPSAAEYSDLFLFQLYPYASVHLGPEGMMGGEARARVAGFWRALGQDPPAEPDHLAALLGLYANLAEREGGAAAAEAERRLLRESRHALLHEHLTPWIFAFLQRVRELDRRVFASWAEILDSVLRAEIRVLGTDGVGELDGRRLPLQLRAAPPLPDPRADGASDFIGGLLAPVRCGLILTRADLARIAAACDVGLRAGERRYALEHLLAQDGAAVLDALAGEARRQAELHAQRAGWLGGTGRFHLERARTTADLLTDLAREERRRAAPAAEDEGRTGPAVTSEEEKPPEGSPPSTRSAGETALP